MQTRHEYWFDLDADDSLNICRFTDSVNFSTDGQPDEFNIKFRPCHLSDLRELVLELEALRDKQQQREEQARLAELSESEVPA